VPPALVEQPAPYPVPTPPPPPAEVFWFVEQVVVWAVVAPAVEHPFAPPTPVPVEHPFGPALPPDVETGAWALKAVIVITTRPSSGARIAFPIPSACIHFCTVDPTSSDLAVTSTLECKCRAVSLPNRDDSTSADSKTGGSGVQPRPKTKEPTLRMVK
jgi:hypothetical protein